MTVKDEKIIKTTKDNTEDIIDRENDKNLHKKENTVLNQPKLKSLTKDEKYLIYEYPYEKIEDSGYISISIIINEKLDYLSIYVGP